MPETVVPTGEDSIVATYTMASGALCQITYIPSGPGQRWISRTVHGRGGSLGMPRDRTGGQLSLMRADGTFDTEGIRALLPDFALDEVTSRLFGGAVSYNLPFAESDAALMAIEIYDFADAVLSGRQPEVGGYEGMIAVAAVLAAFEGGIAGRPVTIAEMLEGRVTAYQDEIDVALGLAVAAE